MGIYLNGISCISPQETFLKNVLPEVLIDHSGQTLSAIDPAYKDYLDPKLARRMGRVIKMGVAAGMSALREAGLEVPDAVLTGTGMGCIEDTEKFLGAIIENDETMLTPTCFIQSTHNTIGGQIALMLGCKGYNFAYVNTGFSFESALIDAMLGFSEGRFKSVLVGGIDEQTGNRITVLKQLGLLREDEVALSQMISTPGKGTKMSEGSAFFVLSDSKKEGTYAELLAVRTAYRPESPEPVTAIIAELLREHDLKSEETLFLMGYNGDTGGDKWYADVEDQFQDAGVATFKLVSGESFTATATGLWITAQLLRSRSVPQYLMRRRGVSRFKHILVVNHYNQINFSFILVSRV